jgi:acetylornithine deacetylase/succinyl-diaminopimelate desuccinylase-like protein
MPLRSADLAAHVANRWTQSITPAIERYITIPALSPHFDTAWEDHGHLEAALQLLVTWAQPVVAGLPGAELSVIRLPGRTPVLLVDVPARVSDSAASKTPRNVVLYGHMDKQPEMTGWRSDLGPWKPVRDGDLLYGRGGADDGYSTFAALTAIEAVQAAGGDYPRCIVLIEASEESGSPDLPAYVDALAARIGTPDLVIALDSGCLDYERMWVTTSLRGLSHIDLTVEMLTEGVHSGGAGGVVSDTFRIARALLSRIEDESTGELLIPECIAEIPAQRIEEATATAEQIGEDWPFHHEPFVPGAQPNCTGANALLAKTWRGSVAVVGADGLPPTATAGNVLRPLTRLTLATRLPPTVDAQKAHAALVSALTTDPPHGARVTAEGMAQGGWHAPLTAPWLASALDSAGSSAFGSAPRSMGEGGSIPFMGMLGEKFPDAQFVITGVLGPGSNAHGPNEFLHLPMAERLTVAIAHVLNETASR